MDDVGSGGAGKAKMIRPEDQGGGGLKWKGGKREEERRKKEELWDRTGRNSQSSCLQSVCLTSLTFENFVLHTAYTLVQARAR